MIDSAYGEGVVWRTTVYTWFSRFKKGRESLDVERTGWPLSAVTDENEAGVRALLKQDCHMSHRMLADELNMSKDSVA